LEKFLNYFFEAYGLGLIFAFMGLILMGKAQPALFYLCPTHLIITITLACVRKEFRRFWSGEPLVNEIARNSPNVEYESLQNLIENEEQSVIMKGIQIDNHQS
jgi:hypothetical protein